MWLEFGRGEVGKVLRVAGTAQAAAEVVGPGVVGAGDRVRGAAAFEQLVGPVLADVVEGPQHAALVTNHRDRHSGHGGRHVGAGIPDELDVADPLPRAGEHGALFVGEPLGFGVGVGVERQGRPGVG